MIGSFFLIVYGSYYLGKYVFEMKDSNTYKLVLVITIVVVIAETLLLIIKLNKDSEKVYTNKSLKENSFAYKFNRKYRSTFVDTDRTKVYAKAKKE
jgi:hypothetical protein